MDLHHSLLNIMHLLFVKETSWYFSYLYVFFKHIANLYVSFSLLLKIPEVILNSYNHKFWFCCPVLSLIHLISMMPPLVIFLWLLSFSWQVQLIVVYPLTKLHQYAFDQNHFARYLSIIHAWKLSQKGWMLTSNTKLSLCLNLVHHIFQLLTLCRFLFVG